MHLNTNRFLRKMGNACLMSYQLNVQYTLPPKSLNTPISVDAIKHACYSDLGEGQGEGQHLCKLGAFLKKL